MKVAVIGIGVEVRRRVAVAVEVWVAVTVAVHRAVSVAVAVWVGVRLGVDVLVEVGVGDKVAVAVGVAKMYPAANTAPRKSAETTNKVATMSRAETVTRPAGLEGIHKDLRAEEREIVT